jgi:D-alanyl-D-alanine endopeptidase (penicillin-binding protein 7)
MHQERRLHSLEKVVVVFAVLAVLALTVGFAEAGGPKHRTVLKETRAHHGDQPAKVHLRSAVALVQDVETGEVVLGKNSDAAVPIASITKLMTAMVILDSDVDLEETIALTREDVDRRKGTRSRLRTGLEFSRHDLLLLALMASENRAAAALGRTYPGGMEAFVAAMNGKARELGMEDTRFADPTGLSSSNVSSARDLARLVNAAHEYDLIRDYSTRERAVVEAASGRRLAYRNTNGLVRSPKWEIGLSKTGYISEAGRCLVMRVKMASKDLVVVLLDSWGKYSRTADARRIRRWLETAALADERG